MGMRVGNGAGVHWGGGWWADGGTLGWPCTCERARSRLCALRSRFGGAIRVGMGIRGGVGCLVGWGVGGSGNGWGVVGMGGVWWDIVSGAVAADRV
jgi:hypothetical protein